MARTKKKDGNSKKDHADAQKPKRRAQKANSAGASRAKKSSAVASRAKTAKRRKASNQKQSDKHTASSAKAQVDKFRGQLVQYMDTNGYISWSAKRRKYTILGTNSTDGGLVPCPNCGVGQLLVVKSPKSGKRFIGCSNFYGGCDASSPLLQRARLRATKKPCKECKWPEVIFRYSSRQKWTRQCSNMSCKTRSQARRAG